MIQKQKQEVEDLKQQQIQAQQKESNTEEVTDKKMQLCTPRSCR
jgi:hypothetical protein